MNSVFQWRHVVVVHQGSWRDRIQQDVVANFQKFKDTQPALKAGIFGDLSPSGLRSVLRRPDHVVTIFVAGDAEEWVTLEATQESDVRAPVGVIVLAKSPQVWAKLRNHRELGFVFNATGTHFPRFGEFFPNLGPGSFGDTQIHRVAPLINEWARGHFAPTSEEEIVPIPAPYALA